MKIELKIKIKYDCEDGVNARQMIIDELFEVFPGVIGDGEVFINEISIDDSPMFTHTT